MKDMWKGNPAYHPEWFYPEEVVYPCKGCPSDWPGYIVSEDNQLTPCTSCPVHQPKTEQNEDETEIIYTNIKE